MTIPAGEIGPPKGRRPGTAVLLALVLLAGAAVWPEPGSIRGMIALVVLGSLLGYLTPWRVAVATAVGFAAALAGAGLVFHLTRAKGLFLTDYQDPLVTDSQFLLHCAIEYARTGSMEALRCTWGSPVPVIWGALATAVFDGLYPGLVFLNAAAYAGASSLVVKQFPVSSRRSADMLTIVLSLLPLTVFYDGMLAKEPVYWVLVAAGTHAIYRLRQGRAGVSTLAMLVLSCLVLIVFRPVAAILVLGFGLFAMRGRRAAWAKWAVVGVVATIGAGGAWIIVNGIDAIPLPTLAGADGLLVPEQVSFLLQAAESKGLPGWLAPVVSPPLSILASPVLGPVWLVAPFPMLGAAVVSAKQLLDGVGTFQSAAVLVRGLDSLTIVVAIVVAARVVRVRDLPRVSDALEIPILAFTAASVMVIASFQFLESARHRYTVTPVVICATWWLVERARGRPTRSAEGFGELP